MSRFVALIALCLLITAFADQSAVRGLNAKAHFDKLFTTAEVSRRAQDTTTTTTTAAPAVYFPTNAPKGWIYQNSYAGNVCNVGSVLTRYAVVTNTCFTSRDINGVQNSFAYTCDGSAATFMSFSGNNCEGAASVVTLPLQCYFTADANAYQYANELACDVDQPTVKFPQNSAYVVDYKYTKDTCDSTAIMSYVANLDSVCIALSQTSSFKMSYPKVEHYGSTSNCQAAETETVQVTTIPASMCQNTPYDPTDVGATRYPAEPYMKTVYEDSHVVPARRLRGV